MAIQIVEALSYRLPLPSQWVSGSVYGQPNAHSIGTKELLPTVCVCRKDAIDVVWEYVKQRLIHSCPEAFVNHTPDVNDCHDCDFAGEKTLSDHLKDVNYNYKEKYSEWYFP